jgi:Putative beta-barrel porin-2, OmpL-like. bbp2
MHLNSITSRKRLFVWPILLASLCLIIIPCRLFGDDKGSTDSTSDTSRKVAAPVSMTERERMLLDRLEELEKRVRELESKNENTSVRPETVPPRPASPAPTAVDSAAPVPVAAVPQPVTAAVPAGSSIGAASQEAATSGASQAAEPFAFADFTWLNGNARTKDIPMDTKFFTPEIRADVSYVYDFNHPKDDTIGGSSEVFRSNEVQLTQLGVGGDFHYDNVRARVMTQFGLYSQTTPRNDASPARGQWNLDNAYRYLSEAYGGYHINALHGINIDAGIFMSYIGLFSYYNFDNWAYQPSYVSSNTPWFFNGVRVQIFPTAHLKIEPWFVNGWQSYGRFNGRPGFGMQILWRPNGWFSVLGNQYALGEEALGNPGRVRYHTDDSMEVKYYDKPDNFVSKMAFSLTGDLGCEHGGGVSCYTNSKKGPKQDFLGFMFYNRTWFDRDKFGLTLGGGKINNPGRYLVLLPPINGATAASGTPYFTENPGDPFKAWDVSGTFDYMPRQYITFRWEFDHRAANVPYFSGPGGITPTSCPTSPLVENICGSPGAVVPGFTPDLRKIENRIDLSILVKF